MLYQYREKLTPIVPAASESLFEDKRPSGSRDTKSFITMTGHRCVGASIK